MRDASTIAPDMTVQRLLTLWPQTARVFMDRRMACVGCAFAAFETIREVAASYDQDLHLFLEALRRAARNHTAAVDGEAGVGR